MVRQKSRLPLDVRGLIDREEIFRIAPGSKRDLAVEKWLNGKPSELRSIAKKWFVEMRKCGADVRESMHDGCPVACVEDAPFAYVNTFTTHVNVGFYNGAKLDDSAGVLQGSGKRMRHAKLKADAEYDEQSLRRLIESAYRDVKRRLASA